MIFCDIHNKAEVDMIDGSGQEIINCPDCQKESDDYMYEYYSFLCKLNNIVPGPKLISKIK